MSRNIPNLNWRRYLLHRCRMCLQKWTILLLFPLMSTWTLHDPTVHNFHWTYIIIRYWLKKKSTMFNFHLCLDIFAGKWNEMAQTENHMPHYATSTTKFDYYYKTTQGSISPGVYTQEYNSKRRHVGLVVVRSTRIGVHWNVAWRRR